MAIPSFTKYQIERLIQDEMNGILHERNTMISTNSDFLQDTGNTTQDSIDNNLEFPSLDENLQSKLNLQIKYGYDPKKNPLLYELDKKLREGIDFEKPNVFNALEREKIDFVYKALEFQNLSLLKENYKEQYPTFLNLLQGVQNSIDKQVAAEKLSIENLKQEREMRNSYVGNEINRLTIELENLQLEEGNLCREIHYLKQQLFMLQDSKMEEST